MSFSGKLVLAVLESLISSAEVTLPPVNWAAVLSPILRANFGKLLYVSVLLCRNCLAFFMKQRENLIYFHQ